MPRGGFGLMREVRHVFLLLINRLSFDAQRRIASRCVFFESLQDTREIRRSIDSGTSNQKGRTGLPTTDVATATGQNHWFGVLIILLPGLPLIGALS